jgi:hypothetical protein
MEVQQSDQEVHFYQIRIAGCLDESWSTWLDCKAVSFEIDEVAQTVVTVLTCLFEDQPALHGLLNKIFDMNLTLLSVTRCSPEDAPRTTDK